MKDLITHINTLAILGLKEMFDQEKQLFHYRCILNNDEVIKEGYSLRYTIISLLGLHKCELTGSTLPIDIRQSFNNILQIVQKVDNIGDLGLLLWLCALVDPNQLERISFDDNIMTLQLKYSDARQKKTTELAWFLTGLSHLILAYDDPQKDFERISFSIYEMLKENYGGKGIFGHQSNNSVTGIIRGHIGSFADQVYPIYALCKFAQAYNNKDALKIATECGEKICAFQGTLGQWWWHYNAISGKVLGRYPVYSVHQHGMAPMALHELQLSTGINVHYYISKGLQWITGENELNYNLIDYNRNMIWRSFYRKKIKMYSEEILSLAGYNRGNFTNNDLKILYECRPYCLGWLLYAWADKRHIIL